MFLKKDILLCCTMNEKLSNYFLLVHQSLVIFFFFRVMQIRLMSFMRLLPQRLPQLIRCVLAFTPTNMIDTSFMCP
jgi:hypothetical protein